MRSRGRTHQSRDSHAGHGRSRSHSTFVADAADDSVIRPSTDYYETDESPVEIKVPRTKNHDPYVSSHNGRTRHRSQSNSDSHHHAHHSTSQPFRHSSPNSIRPDVHKSSPTTYSRKRPNYSLDSPSQPSTPQPLIYSRQENPTHSTQHGTINPASDSVITAINTRHSYPSQNSHPEYQQTHKSYQQDGSYGHKDIYRSTGGHRRSHSRGLKFNDNAAEGGAVIVDSYEITSPTARPSYFFSTPILNQNSNEFVDAADMELKRVQPHKRTRTTTPRPSENKGKGNSSADILHSVSISISSRVSLDNNDKSKDDNHDDNNYHAPSHKNADEHPQNELPESEDYDIYSPQYSNYKATTLPPPPTSRPVVPIQFFHVKPTDVSSFQPAKTIIDEEDEYDIG